VLEAGFWGLVGGFERWVPGLWVGVAGRSVGLITTLGFVLAFLLSQA